MYHSISATANPRFREFAVSPATFAEQMEYLYKQAYTSITISHYVKALSGKADLPERPIILTFDDGFADFLTAALPVLQRYAFTATLYISTAFINSTSRWLRYERETMRPMLTNEQIIEVSANNIECGAHSHSHPQLDTLSHHVALVEISQSKRLLEDLLGLEVLSFAYPFGYYTSQIRRLVQEAGFLSACAVKHKLSSEQDDVFSLSRLMVRGQLPIEDFATLLSGNTRSPIATAYQAYIQLRTPIWQIVRRGMAPFGSRLFQGEFKHNGI